MNTLTDSLITILEHPNAEKGYKEFQKYLEKTKRKEDAEAINYLIKAKFKNVSNDTNSNSQQ